MLYLLLTDVTHSFLPNKLNCMKIKEAFSNMLKKYAEANIKSALFLMLISYVATCCKAGKL
jgi:hypothetical protein